MPLLKIPFRYISLVVNWIFGLPFMQQLAGRYPRFFQFLQKRFDPSEFFGLPFTFILALAVANLSLLSELSENIVNSREMKLIDSFVSMMLFKFRTPFLARIFYHFTRLGNVTGMAVFIGIAGCFMLLYKKWYYLLAMAISVSGNAASVYLVKSFFHRERPLDIGYYTLSTFSFPSGHAASAVAIQGLLCYFLMLEAKTVKMQLCWFFIGLSYVALMGFSRIYLGVHFISDVAGGYSVGFLWLLFGVVCMEFAAYKKSGSPGPENIETRP